MRDTPDVPHGPDPRATDPPSSSQETPTLDFRGRSAPAAPPAPARRPEPADFPLPPELLGHPRYRVVAVLGKGGMGTVYKAEHRMMKRPVALTVMADHLVADPEAVLRFRREVEAAAKLSHPNIVTAYDAEQAGECHFLVMELVDGMSLDRVLNRKGRLPVHFACEYIRQAALGLQHAHEHGMVHRDIKLQNLMLTRKGQVKILDFGLARFACASTSAPAAPLTENGFLTGTPDFMSPEQTEDPHGADIRADIYSLGCTLYALLAGQLPFPGGTSLLKIVGHLTKEPTPLTDFRDDLPPELVQLVARMMAKDPARRFQTPAEVAKALLSFRKPGATAEGSGPAADLGDSPTPPNERLPDAPTASPTPGKLGHATRDSAEPRTEDAPDTERIPSLRKSRSSSGRRRKRPPARRFPLGIAVAAGVVGLLGLGGLLAVILSGNRTGDRTAGATQPSAPAPPAVVREEGQGQVTIASRDPHVQVAVRRGTTVVGTLGPDTSTQLALPAGEYELEVVDGAPELRGFKGRLSLTPNDRKLVEVRLEGLFVRDGAAGFPPPKWPDGPPPKGPFGPPPGGPKGW